MTVDEILTDSIQGLELLKPAMPFVVSTVPEAGPILVPLLAILENALLAVREARRNGEDVELIRARVRANVTEAIQNLAIMKLGASL